MATNNTSVCIQCGKPRIVVGTHDEVIGNSTVTHVDTVCPDPECQKKVEGFLKLELEKRQESATNRQRKIYRGKSKVNLGKS